MLRYGLVSYLLFVMIAGPCYCCCTLTRLAGQLTPCTGSDDTPARTCCHCCQSHSSNSEDNEASPGQPQPKKNNDCPCQKNRGTFLAQDSTGWDSTRLSQLISFFQIDSMSVDLFVKDEDKANHALTFRRRGQAPFGTFPLSRALSMLQTFLC